MSDTTDESPAPGVEFVYETALKKIEQQARLIDSLDVKMGVLIGFLGTFVAGILVAVLTSEASKIAPRLWWPTKVTLSLSLALVLLGLVFAYSGFKARQYYSEVRLRDLVTWIYEEVWVTKEAFLPTLLGYIDENDLALGRKQMWAQWAIRAVFTALALIWLAVALLGAQLFFGKAEL